MRKLISLSALILFVNFLRAQDFTWAKSMGGTNIQASEATRSIAVDASGNTYTTGSFGGIVDFDPGAGVFNMGCNGCQACCNPEDIFIVKLDASGNFVWAKQIGGTQTDVGMNIITDNTANLYITGWFTGTVDFDPGAGTSNLTSVTGGSGFILKLNSNGGFLWAVRTSAEIGYKLVLNGANLYFSGLKYNGPSNNGYIASYTTSGGLVMEKQFSGTSNNTTCLVAVDASNNIYATGAFNNTMDFNPGAGVANLTSAGSTDIYITKLDGSGNFVWAKQIGGIALEASGPINFDTAGNIIVAGAFQGTTDFNPGPDILNFTPVSSSDGFIIKLNNAGDLVWARQIAGTTASSSISISSFVVDNFQNILYTGYFIGTVDFDPGAGNFNLTNTNPSGGGAMFISKLDPYGDFINAKHIGNANGTAITADQSLTTGGLYLTGIYFQTTDFDPGVGVFNMSSVGGSDMFILKLTIRTAGDTDWDGIADGNDNCPSASNVMQVDTDVDNIGNACDDDDDNDGSLDVNDCAPLDPSIHPGATELCNNIDDNCNGEIDEGFRFYRDSDGDGYGDPNNFMTDCTGAGQAGYVSNHGDCNDNFDFIHPGATEICNNLDDDCDGQIDEDARKPTISPSGTVNICSGTTILLTASKAGSYQWYRNNKVLQGQTAQTLVVNTSGGYKVRVFYDLCPPTEFSDVTAVNVVTAPNATISYRGNTDICSSGSLLLKANNVKDGVYQWNKDAAPIVGANQQTYTATQPGSYTITISKNGCSTTSAPVVITNSCPSAPLTKRNIIGENKFSTLLVFPNPTNGEFYITVKNGTISSSRINFSVTDISGRVIFGQSETIMNGYFHKQFKMPDQIAGGLYFIRVHDGQAEVTGKLLLIRR